MKEQKSSPLGYYMLGICALFLAGFLMMVILKPQTYMSAIYLQRSLSLRHMNQTYMHYLDS